MCFVKILFHCCQVAVGIDFTREKNLFLTCFTHCKVVLWKSCELDLILELTVNYFSIGKTILKIGCNSTEKQIYVHIFIMFVLLGGKHY
jgi:hypothetical protein